MKPNDIHSCYITINFIDLYCRVNFVSVLSWKFHLKRIAAVKIFTLTVTGIPTGKTLLFLNINGKAGIIHYRFSYASVNSFRFQQQEPDRVQIIKGFEETYVINRTHYWRLVEWKDSTNMSLILENIFRKVLDCE